jgi:uncharacterized protein YndB with AHSA1/START domain
MKAINYNAPVTCAKEIQIKASKEKVWDVLTGINAWPSWQSDIPRAELKGDLKPGSEFHWKTGGAGIVSTLHTVEPYSQFGWTGKTFGMYAIHNWNLEEKNGITTVKVDESMEGFLAKLLRSSFNKNLQKGMQHWLDLLKNKSER